MFPTVLIDGPHRLDLTVVLPLESVQATEPFDISSVAAVLPITSEPGEEGAQESHSSEPLLPPSEEAGPDRPAPA
jgi:hypothetical protein